MQSTEFIFHGNIKIVWVLVQCHAVRSHLIQLSVLKSHCVHILNLYATAVPRKHIVIPMPSTEDSIHYLGLSPAVGTHSHLTKHATLACH